MTPERGIQPLDVGGVNACPGASRIQYAHDRLGGPAHYPLAAADDVALSVTLDHLADQQARLDHQVRASRPPGAHVLSVNEPLSTPVTGNPLLSEQQHAA